MQPKPIHKLTICLVILTLSLQPLSPAFGAAAKTENTSDHTVNITEGATLGSAIPPEARAPDPNVPDFGAQIAAQASAQPQETTPPRLKATLSPAIYLPGRPVTLRWQIIGLEQPAQLTIQPPGGVTPNDTTLSADGLLNIPISDTSSGSLQWTVGPSAQFPLNFNLRLSVDGEHVAEQTVLIDRSKYNISANGGEITARGGRVNIDVPANAISQALAFDVRDPSPQQMPPISLSGYPLEIVAVGENDGADIKQFGGPITIHIQYDPHKIYRGTPDSLSLYYYDPETADWFPLPTTVDTTTQTLTAQSDHLTVFDYKANNWQTDSLPTVDNFKVADFTGAATYSLSVWTPPGPGGMQPNVSLNYNSQVIDESSAYSQASWVGMGWSLETGAITRNMHDSDSDLSDDTFNISVGGISGLLLPVSVAGDITRYNTADQSYAKVEYNSSSDTWTAWSKDGTTFTFDQTAKTNTTNGCAASTNALNLTWKWSLGSTTDTFGNQMTYTYSNETKSAACFNEIAVYPDTILYPNGKYRVRFERDSVLRKDYQTSWTDPNARSLYGTYRLKTIWIEHKPSGTWNPIRQYALTYAPNNANNGGIYPQFIWSGGAAARTLTLLGVQEKSGDGSALLPAATFTYADKMHITQFSNGQGGAVQVSYERWHYFDDINDLARSLFTLFGVDECSPTIGTAWTGFSVRCDGSGNPYLQIGNYTKNESGSAQRSIPEHVIKPGGRFRYAIDLKSQSGSTSATYGIVDTDSGQSSLLTQNNIGTGGATLDASFEMPLDYNPASTMLQLSCDHCWVSKVQFAVMPSWWRVTSRTVTDTVSSPDSLYTYRYDNAMPNAAAVSGAVAAVGSNYAALYTPPLREYRGNAMTQVVNQDGLATITWYQQSDALKGRASHTLTMQQTPGSYDPFDTLGSSWSAVGDNQITIDPAEYDSYVETSTTTTSFDASLTHSAASINDGQMAVGHFKLTGAQSKAELGLLNSAGKFFGLLLDVPAGSAYLRTKTAGSMITGSTPLTPLTGGAALSVVQNKWYVAEFFADSGNGFRLRIWQQDDPANAAEATLGGFAPDTWQFRQRIKSAVAGTTSQLDMDAYFEGTPYSESETTFSATTQYDTNAGGSIPDLANASLMAYKDLAVVWVAPSESVQRNYNGDAAWVGTRSTYIYNTSDQGGAQYGNLTRQRDFAWDGAAWAAYRGARTQYFPNVALNLLALPARQLSLDCQSGSCDFSGGIGKMGETLYLYDGSQSYTAPPVAGHLSARRVWAQNGDYIQTSSGYDPYGNLTSQTVYTGYATSGADPTTGAETSTSGYDAYHTYANVMTNALGQQTQLHYDKTLGLPDQVTDANNVTTTASYDPFGRMTAITAPLDSSPTLQISYHEYQNATHPFRVDLTQRVNATANIRLSRFYNGLGQQVQTQTLGAVVNGIQHNIVTDSQYDALGRPVKQTTPYTIGYADPPTWRAQTFPASLTTQTSYDALGRVTLVAPPNGDNVTSTYDDPTPAGQRLTTSVSDPKGNTSMTMADVWGRSVGVHPPTGPDLSYSYDVLGQLKSATKGSGSSATTTSIQYDNAGRKTDLSDPDMGDWHYSYDGAGNLKTQTDARNCETHLSYDALNRLTDKAYLNCPTTPAVQYHYDEGGAAAFALGRRTSMSDGSGSTTWSYDARGRVWSETKTISGASPFTTTTTYNSADLPVTQQYPDNETLTYAYDSAGNLLSLTGSQVYASGMKYDEAARLKTLTLGDNLITRSFTYNPWNTPTTGGLLASLTATRVADQQALQSLSYDYDADGNIQSINNTIAGETSTYTYDALNRLTSVTISGGGQNGGNEAFDYDPANGNLLHKGPTTTTWQQYFYDPNHPHAVTSVSPLPGGEGQGEGLYAYDPNGNMTQRLEPSGLNRYLTYDAENRLISVIQQPGPTATHTATPTEMGQARTPTFTPTLTSTGTATATPTPTEGGDLPSLTPSPQHSPTATEPNGRPSPTIQATVSTTLTATPTATVTPTDAESDSDATPETTLPPSITPSPEPTDDNGRSVPSNTPTTQTTATVTTTPTEPGQAATVTATPTAQETDSDGPTPVTSSTPSTTGSPTATQANGRPTRTPTTTPTRTATSTLTATATPLPTPTLQPFTGASYVYDGDGNLVKGIINGVVTYYVSASYQVTGNVVTKYYGSYAMRAGASLYYLLSDHLGSTNITLDASGQFVAELRYTAFGEVRYADRNTPTDYRYTGQLEQRDLGLYFYKARWYDPALGRFTQADTIVPGAGNPQAFDRYAYVSNNPLRYFDPTGKCEVDMSGHLVHFSDGSPQCGGVGLGGNGQSNYCSLRDDDKICELNNGAFIDESHYSTTAAQKLWDRLQKARHLGKEVPVDLTQESPGASFTATYTIDGSTLQGMTDKELREVGLGIWLDFQTQYETWQGQVYPSFLSSFHREDIPSTYLAYVDIVMGNHQDYGSIVSALGGGSSSSYRWPWDSRDPNVENRTMFFMTTSDSPPGYVYLSYPDALTINPAQNNGYWAFKESTTTYPWGTYVNEK